jgi:hypothetical protein
VPNKPEIATDTSSCAAASTCVVEPAAAACAARIADPIPVKSCDAAAKASGVATTKDDIISSSTHQVGAQNPRKPSGQFGKIHYEIRFGPACDAFQKHTIPERKDNIARRKTKGSTGGRPPAFDPALYGLRNTVEASTGSSGGAASPPATTVMMNRCRLGARGLTRVTTGLRCLVFDLSTTDPGRCLLPSGRPGVSLYGPCQ